MISRLRFVSGIAILCVVLFHAAGMGFVAMFAWAHRYLPAGVAAASQIGSLPYYAGRVIEQLVVFCIPAFIFISGYFIAFASGSSQQTVSWKVLFARVKNLFIPYLIWSSVNLLLSYFTGESYKPIDIVWSLLTGSSSEILYYVPLIVQFYLLSPLFVKAAKKNWRILLGVTFILQLLISALTYQVAFENSYPFMQFTSNLLPKWLFLTRIFWFPLGIVVGFHTKEFKQWLLRSGKWLIPSSLFLLVVGIFEWEFLFRTSGLDWLPHRETITDVLYSLAAIFSLLSFDFGRSKLGQVTETLGARSYGIFLTHGIFIVYAAKVIYHATPAILGYQFLFQPLLFLVGIGFPLLIMKLSEISPLKQVYNYLYG